MSDDYVGEVQIVYNNTMFTESKEDGVMQIPIKLLCLKYDTIKAKLEFKIDGVILLTPTIEFIWGGDFEYWTPTYFKNDYDKSSLWLLYDFGDGFWWDIYDGYCEGFYYYSYYHVMKPYHPTEY